MKLSELAVDPERQENGAWVDDIPEVQGLRLKVRGSFNADWRRLQAKLLDAVPRKKRMGGRLDPDDNDAIMTKCLLNCCLLDWEGLEDENGNAIPYDKEYARKLLSEPEFRRFRESVIWAANVVQETTDTETEDNLGNLVKLSDGNTAGERSKKAG